MDAPICRTCGKKHWSRVCPGDDVRLTPDAVTLPVERNITAKPARNVTSNATEIEALRAEVAMLKRQLAEAGTKQVACPDCERRRLENAERVRKSRAKQHG